VLSIEDGTINTNDMATPKKYFHDHFVLLLLSINGFLTAAVIIFILLKLTSSHGNGYIVQYRPSLGINAYQTGSVIQLVSFAVFAALITAINSSLSYRVYKIHRQLAITILSLGVLLLVLTIVVSNALILLK
jgi:hypothetical protein